MLNATICWLVLLIFNPAAYPLWLMPCSTQLYSSKCLIYAQLRIRLIDHNLSVALNILFQYVFMPWHITIKTVKSLDKTCYVNHIQNQVFKLGNHIFHLVYLLLSRYKYRVLMYHYIYIYIYIYIIVLLLASYYCHSGMCLVAINCLLVVSIHHLCVSASDLQVYKIVESKLRAYVYKFYIHNISCNNISMSQNASIVLNFQFQRESISPVQFSDYIQPTISAIKH